MKKLFAVLLVVAALFALAGFGAYAETDKEYALRLYNETKAVFDSNQYTLRYGDKRNQIVYVRNGDAFAVEAMYTFRYDFLTRLFFGKKLRIFVTQEKVIYAAPYRFVCFSVNDTVLKIVENATNVNFFTLNGWYDLPEVQPGDIAIEEKSSNGFCIVFPGIDPQGQETTGRLYFQNEMLSRIAYASADGSSGYSTIHALKPEPDMKYFSTKWMIRFH